MSEPVAHPRPARTTERPRLTIAHDVEGPRVRLGIAWLVATLVVTAVGRLPLAIVLAVAAALAADEIVRLRFGVTSARDGAAPAARAAAVIGDPARLPAVLTSASLPLAAAGGADLLTAALVTATIVVLGYRLTVGPAGSAIAHVAGILLPAVALGMAAAAPVLLHGLGPPAAAVLLVLAAAYDAGDFVVGTGAATRWEGPATGAATVAVVGFALSVVALPPTDRGGILLMTGVAALLAPAGPPAGALLVGDGRINARFVRRLDSLLVMGPVAAYAGAAAFG